MTALIGRRRAHRLRLASPAPYTCAIKSLLGTCSFSPGVQLLPEQWNKADQSMRGTSKEAAARPRYYTGRE
ncbi:hypothetical protein [Hymenobacter cavernae]|uniref:hypothetical protein n=1 Tax=Hymenobacter cavernae TaxID=2044852 RepID=UPI0016632002|nr:hypothetical protein [Hymenobacter cavernae]